MTPPPNLLFLVNFLLFRCPLVGTKSKLGPGKLEKRRPQRVNILIY